MVRKCSYVIWINRYNKDFQCPRIQSAVGTDASLPLTDKERVRISRNHDLARKKLRHRKSPAVPLTEGDKIRISINHEIAKVKLRLKKKPPFTWRSVHPSSSFGFSGHSSSSSATSTLEIKSSAAPVLDLTNPHSGSDISPDGAASLTSTGCDNKTSTSQQGKWTLLDSPGLSLRNKLNNCWFHATLHLLTAVPAIRTLCLSPTRDTSGFESSLLCALRSIFDTRVPSLVNAFFPLVRDCNGANHRYGQIAVPDFLEYLCVQSPNLLRTLQINYSTRLQCSVCRWISSSPTRDVSLKLYLPSTSKRSILGDLMDYNSNVVFIDDDAVFCRNCNSKTSHSSSRDYNSDLFLIEFIRVTQVNNGWIKNSLPIDFPVQDLKLPGFSRSYRVIASCHHRGTLRGGHWFTKISTVNGWYELDDLKPTCYRTVPPGTKDQTAVVLLLAAEDKLKQK